MPKAITDDRITIRGIDPKVWLRVRAEAIRQGKNVGQLLTEIVRAYLKKKK